MPSESFTVSVEIESTLPWTEPTPVRFATAMCVTQVSACAVDATTAIKIIARLFMASAAC